MFYFVGNCEFSGFRNCQAVRLTLVKAITEQPVLVLNKTMADANDGERTDEKELKGATGGEGKRRYNFLMN